MADDEKIPRETAGQRHVIPDDLWEEAAREVGVLTNYGGPTIFDKANAEFVLDMADAIYAKIVQFGDPEEWRRHSRETRLRDLKIRILDYIRKRYDRARGTSESRVK